MFLFSIYTSLTTVYLWPQDQSINHVLIVYSIVVMSIQNQDAIADDETVDSNGGLQDLKREVKVHSSAPSHRTYRYVILALVIVVKVTLNFVMDAPGGIERTIIQVMQIDVTHYNLFYSVYSWPTTVTTFLLGILIDRYLGLRLGSIVFVTVAALGQLVFTVGGYLDSFPTMVVARFISGLGGDTALSVTDALCSVWFKGRELTFMIAMLGFGCRLGGALTLYLNQLIYERLAFITDNHTRLGVTLTVGLGACMVGIISTLLIFIIDRRGEKTRKRPVTARQPFKLKDITEFGTAFWLASASMIGFYTCIFPFVDIAQVFFISKYSLPVNIVSISETSIYLASMTSPATGLLINWTGYNLYWGLASLHLTFGVHLLYFLSSGASSVPFVGNILLGFSHAFYNSAMWVTPAYLVSEHQIATAFGLCSSLNNLGLAVTDLISGVLIDHHGYFIQELLFVCVSSLSILSLYLMIFVLAGKNHQVNMSGAKRRQLLITKDKSNELDTTTQTTKYKTF